MHFVKYKTQGATNVPYNTKNLFIACVTILSSLERPTICSKY